MHIPFRTSAAELERNIFDMDLSVIPRDFSRPIVEMFSKSIMSRPEIILKPATIVISTRMNRTLKSMRSSQPKS